MLDRYKKKGGFFQLLQLLETSNAKKQEQFLGLIGAENKVWELALKQKMLDTSKIFSWPSEYLVEIVSRLQVLTLSGALQGESPEYVDRILNTLGPIGKRKILDQMAEIKPNPGEKVACQFRIVSEVRSMIQQGYIKLEKVDESLAIDENIEEKLAHAPVDTSNDLSKSKVHLSEPEKSNSGGLDFSIADRSSREEIEVSRGMAPNALEEEVRLLRKKVNSIMQENLNLKNENQIYKDKLAQIKKIA